jgi:membrane-associated phospholipid phosphatase
MSVSAITNANHYLVDVLAGIAIAAGCIAAVKSIPAIASGGGFRRLLPSRSRTVAP